MVDAVGNRSPAATALPPFPKLPVSIAVSECLTGGNVRYDGGHRSGAWPAAALAGFVQCQPICPEVGIGMGVPRAPIQLVGDPAAPGARGVVDPAMDVTAALQAYVASQTALLDAVDGYVFKARSPSCGVHDVPVRGGEHEATGRGIFAAAVMRVRPNLPVEEGERLFDAAVREHFLMRVLIHAHWRNGVAGDFTPARLIAFHSGCKYLVMAHSVNAYRCLGRMLADLSGDVPEIAARYFSCLTKTLAQPATRGGHANALTHLAGHLKRRLPSVQRRALAASIERYRLGGAPLSEPMGLLVRCLRESDARIAVEHYYLLAYGAAEGCE